MSLLDFFLDKSEQPEYIDSTFKAIKVRIYPNKEQKVDLCKTFGCCRFIWN